MAILALTVHANYSKPCVEHLERRRLLSTGHLDPSFGSVGTAYAGLFPHGSCDALALAADGKLIVAGTTDFPAPASKFALARFNRDGSLDRRFGARGSIAMRIPGGVSDTIAAVAVQSDGKIIVAGTSTTATFQSRYVVARYLSTGQLDKSFASAGIFELAALNLAEPTSIVIQPDRRILVEGPALVQGPPPAGSMGAFSIVRLTSAGKLDPTFGDGGAVFTTVGNPQHAVGGSMAVDSRGRVIVADHYGDVARFKRDGTMDTGFGVGGLETLCAGGVLGSIAVQSDGKILLPLSNGAVIRLTATGARDLTFGDGGVAKVPRLQNLLAFDALLQENGDVIAVGSVPTADSMSDDLIVARFTPSGKLDNTFGSAGIERTASTSDPGNPSNAGTPVSIIEPDGGIVVALDNFVVRRFTANGALDGTFAYHGQAMNPFGLSGAINAVAIEPDGKILVAGSEVPAASGEPTDAAVARYNSDGTLDTSFATNGVELVQIGDNAAFTSIALARNSDIILGGYGDSGGTEVFAIVRLYYNGYRNRSFGSSGIELTNFGDPNGAKCTSIALQANGDILAAGSTFDSAGNAMQMAIVRYSPNGTLDPSFGVAGQATFKPGGKASGSNNIALQPDGRIILAGSIGTNFGLVRLRRNGSLDSGFGASGIVSTQINDGFGNVRSVATSAQLEKSGDILLGGSVYSGPGQQFYGGAFARYRPDGTLDSTFGHGGTVVMDTTVATNIGQVNSMAVQSDGKALGGGVDRAGASLALRLTSAGAIDSTFGTGGVVELSPEPEQPTPPAPLVANYPPVAALAIQPDGKILAAAGSNLSRLLVR